MVNNNPLPQVPDRVDDEVRCSLPLEKIDGAPKRPRKLLCLYCERTFVSANLRQKHVERVHSSKNVRRASSRKQTPPTACLHCDTTETTLEALFRHLVHRHPEQYFGCEPCEERFVTRAHLLDHDVHAHRVPPRPPDFKEVVIKITRSRVKPKQEEAKPKRVSVKSSRSALRRRESKRLQGSGEEGRKKKGGRGGRVGEVTCASAGAEKITDHSIDNLRIGELTFDDVFDKAFFNRIKCNIEENLLHHIDGKLFENEESESRISNFEKTSVAPQEVQASSSDSYGCELSLNAATPVAALSLTSQFGEDFESQIEYGAKPSKKRSTQTKAEPVFHYKYFTRRKFQASIQQQKENRDLSKLDMWTQLVIKNRQQKMLDERKTPRERQEYAAGDEYRSKMRREELNRILDRRGPFEDLKEEASKKAALEKLNSASGGRISEQSFAEVRDVLEEVLERVFGAIGDVEGGSAVEEGVVEEDVRELPSYLCLRRTCGLPSEGEVDRSDRIALICSSQETENYELPTNPTRRRNELVELSGEWARSRLYVCAACGAKLPNMKYLVDHKSLYHQHVWTQHYEFVGNQNELYRHLSIPALGKVGHLEDTFQGRSWKRSEARACTKCGKRCNSLGELHRHVLECGGDWSWMVARKKCKYRPCKSRRKRLRGLVHRIRHKEKESPPEKKTCKKTLEGPRQRPSDAETIQRMLANLPAKRSTRKLISLYDGVHRARKNQQKSVFKGNENAESSTRRSLRRLLDVKRKLKTLRQAEEAPKKRTSPRSKKLVNMKTFYSVKKQQEAPTEEGGSKRKLRRSFSRTKRVKVESESAFLARPPKIVIPSSSGAEETAADISESAQTATSPAKTDGDVPDDEKSLQAKGDLDFDAVAVAKKGRPRKPRLDDCIAMLTSKLQQQVRPQCILKIPAFRGPQLEGGALDLSVKTRRWSAVDETIQRVVEGRDGVVKLGVILKQPQLKAATNFDATIERVVRNGVAEPLEEAKTENSSEEDGLLVVVRVNPSDSEDDMPLAALVKPAEIESGVGVQGGSVGGVGVGGRGEIAGGSDGTGSESALEVARPKNPKQQPDIVDESREPLTDNSAISEPKPLGEVSIKTPEKIGDSIPFPTPENATTTINSLVENPPPKEVLPDFSMLPKNSVRQRTRAKKNKLFKKTTKQIEASEGTIMEVTGAPLENSKKLKTKKLSLSETNEKQQPDDVDEAQEPLTDKSIASGVKPLEEMSKKTAKEIEETMPKEPVATPENATTIFNFLVENPPPKEVPPNSSEMPKSIVWQKTKSKKTKLFEKETKQSEASEVTGAASEDVVHGDETRNDILLEMPRQVVEALLENPKTLKTKKLSLSETNKKQQPDIVDEPQEPLTDESIASGAKPLEEMSIKTPEKIGNSIPEAPVPTPENAITTISFLVENPPPEEVLPDFSKLPKNSVRQRNKAKKTKLLKKKTKQSEAGGENSMEVPGVVSEDIVDGGPGGSETLEASDEMRSEIPLEMPQPKNPKHSLPKQNKKQHPYIVVEPQEPLTDSSTTSDPKPLGETPKEIEETIPEAPILAPLNLLVENPPPKEVLPDSPELPKNSVQQKNRAKKTKLCKKKTKQQNAPAELVAQPEAQASISTKNKPGEAKLADAEAADIPTMETPEHSFKTPASEDSAEGKTPPKKGALSRKPPRSPSLSSSDESTQKSPKKHPPAADIISETLLTLRKELGLPSEELVAKKTTKSVFKTPGKRGRLRKTHPEASTDESDLSNTEESPGEDSLRSCGGKEFEDAAEETALQGGFLEDLDQQIPRSLRRKSAVNYSEIDEDKTPRPTELEEPELFPRRSKDVSSSMEAHEAQRGETEPPKQKARRKSKSIKKIDTKGHNDLFEDFALVIKKKRSTPFMSFSPPDTFSREDKDAYPLFLPEALEEEAKEELDVSVEEMDMELDEPINASIIENTVNVELAAEKPEELSSTVESPEALVQPLEDGEEINCSGNENSKLDDSALDLGSLVEEFSGEVPEEKLDAIETPFIDSGEADDELREAEQKEQKPPKEFAEENENVNLERVQKNGKRKSTEELAVSIKNSEHPVDELASKKFKESSVVAAALPLGNNTAKEVLQNLTQNENTKPAKRRASKRKSAEDLDATAADKSKVAKKSSKKCKGAIFADPEEPKPFLNGLEHRDIDSIYAFSETEDVELNTPIELPRRLPRNPPKPERQESSSLDEEEEGAAGAGVVKENGVELEVNGRSKHMRSAKAKALEYIHDDAVAEVTENQQRNGELNSSNEAVIEKKNRKPKRNQAAPEAMENAAFPYEALAEDEAPLLAELVAELHGLEELENSIERELNAKEKPAAPEGTSEENQELRRSRRGSRKIASYNENDLIDPIIEALESKRSKKRETKAEKKLNSDQLFDLLKASTTEHSFVPKQTSFLSDLGDAAFEKLDDDSSLAMDKSLIVSKQSDESSFSSSSYKLLTPDIRDSSSSEMSLVHSTYCDICDKSFIRLENLEKHRRTLRHIQKLSEIEAKEAELKQQNSLQLADVVRYKSLGERKSFDDSKTTIAEEQISLLEGIIDPKPTQYEEISEDKSRKTLNRDEELFLECCSLLKSGSEVSAPRKTHSPLGDSFDDDANWGVPSREARPRTDFRGISAGKVATKGARKVFEGLKVSIPTEELNLEEVLNCGPRKPSRKSKPVKKAAAQAGGSVLFRVHKKKEKDVYDFEETQDNTEAFPARVPRKKCVIMGRIFKNAAKARPKKKPRSKKRLRANSESDDDEFSLGKRRGGKHEDNCINLEQELKECIGVASRKSQRSCTSGKQNVLVEYWSSDESQFEKRVPPKKVPAKKARRRAHPLYHWSSSEEDGEVVEGGSVEEERPVQHGWIVGESPKKLVMMLAQAKGKKSEVDGVKEQGGRKRVGVVS